MSKMMWNQVEDLYRGQATRGTVVTVDEDAMRKALNNAGNTVFETDWWVETVQSVLEHWGLLSKRWTDPATQVPRVHYRLDLDHAHTSDTTARPGSGPLNPQNLPDAPGAQTPATPTATRQLTPTGPLSARINSGKLTTGDLEQKEK